MAEIPQAVLADRLSEEINGRKVRAAVFTTFSFDPGFFELHILPTLFDIQLSQVEKIKRIQLENALQKVDDIAVYYDRTALAQEALPAQLDFRRIGVRVPQGVFHPKLVFVLVDNCRDDKGQTLVSQSLIFGCLSANLTRGGWWENVEVAHFVEIKGKDRPDERYSYRKDLLGLTKRIMELGGPAEEQIEVISPYFGGDNGGTLARLVDALNPKEIRVYLPRDADGAAKVTEALYESIGELAYWSILPPPITRSGAEKFNTNALPRFTHAKVYRLWRPDGKQIILSGSVNLTDAAHSSVKSGKTQ